MELWHAPVLVIIGVAAGFMNVMAGGGSLLTLPVMIFAGLPPAVANGTNRVALVAQNATAVRQFAKKGFSEPKRSLTLGVCTLPGAIAGSLLAIHIDPLWFKRLLAVVMVAVLISIFKKPKPASAGDEPASRGRLIAAHVSMIGVGFYGGFIQAGVGMIFMAVLNGLMRIDLVRVNMHKVFVIGVYMLPSLIVFALEGKVVWLAGLTLAVGNSTGAWIATKVQIERGEGSIRVVFAVAVLAMAVKLVLG